MQARNAHLRILKLQRHLVVHQRLEVTVVLFIVLLVALLVDLMNCLLVGQVTLNRDMTCIDDEVPTVLSRDAKMKLSAPIQASSMVHATLLLFRNDDDWRVHVDM